MVESAFLARLPFSYRRAVNGMISSMRVIAPTSIKAPVDVNDACTRTP